MQNHIGIDVVLHVPRDNTNPIDKELKDWIDHMEYDYLFSCHDQSLIKEEGDCRGR
jgi:hypothetical protein